MPTPSDPGSHAATKASDAFSSGFTQSGRPEMNTLTVGMPASRNAVSSARPSSPS